MSDSFFTYGFTRTQQELDCGHLAVRGAIPDWLRGTYYRNGPGSIRVGQDQMRHWFDGYAMVHRICFAAGAVSYRSRFLDSRVYRSARAANHVTYREFGTDPRIPSLRQLVRVLSLATSDNAKVNVLPTDSGLLALGETPWQHLLDPEELRSRATFCWAKRHFGQLTTAHPHKKPDELFNIVIRCGLANRYILVARANSGRIRKIGHVRTTHPSYVHSFGMTEHYAILCEYPLRLNPTDMLRWGRPFSANLKWHPNEPMKIHLLELSSGKLVRSYESDGRFAFHHICARETKHGVEFDLLTYDDDEIVRSFSLERIANQQEFSHGGLLRRFVLPWGNEAVRCELLATAELEMPTLGAPTKDGSSSPFVFGIGFAEREKRRFFNQIVKVDVKTATVSTRFETGMYPGEPLFVPKPNAADGDDGILLSIILEPEKKCSSLAVLDAKDLNELAQVELPQPVSFGFHGTFCADEVPRH